MRVLSELVFDEPVEGNANNYCSAEWNDLLGRPDKLVLFAVVSQVDIASSLTVQVEQSPNGIDWLNLNSTAEIDRVAINSTDKTLIVSGMITNAATFVRLRIALSASNDKARVCVFVTGRDEGSG